MPFADILVFKESLKLWSSDHNAPASQFAGACLEHGLPQSGVAPALGVEVLLHESGTTNAHHILKTIH